MNIQLQLNAKIDTPNLTLKRLKRYFNETQNRVLYTQTARASFNYLI